MAVFPVCAGRSPARLTREPAITGFPRMRGEEPVQFRAGSARGEFSPYARGGAPSAKRRARTSSVFPVCAGRSPERSFANRRRSRFPRMRGEEPPTLTNIVINPVFSPYARGGALWQVSASLQACVFPVCAGRSPSSSTSRFPRFRFPRMRGDEPPRLLPPVKTPVKNTVGAVSHAGSKSARMEQKRKLRKKILSCLFSL